jgi:hypothetical protein
MFPRAAQELPVMFGIRENAEAGDLMSYGADLKSAWLYRSRPPHQRPRVPREMLL